MIFITFCSVLSLLFVYIIYVIPYYDCDYNENIKHINKSLIFLAMSLLTCIMIHRMTKSYDTFKYIICMIFPILCLIISYLYMDYQMTIFNNCNYPFSILKSIKIDF